MKRNDDIPYIMTFKECQKILCVGKNTLLRLIHSGQLDAFQIGNRWKITRDAVIDYINNL
jgi:excisionase family DNA binding protein